MHMCHGHAYGMRARTPTKNETVRKSPATQSRGCADGSPNNTFIPQVANSDLRNSFALRPKFRKTSTQTRRSPKVNNTVHSIGHSALGKVYQHQHTHTSTHTNKTNAPTTFALAHSSVCAWRPRKRRADHSSGSPTNREVRLDGA